MSELRVLDDSGDVKTIWDKDKSDEVAAVRRQFDDLRAKRYLAFRVEKDGAKGKLITEFDPDAERIILTPPIAGG